VALAVLAVYAVVAAMTGAGFYAAEAFPLGGTSGDGVALSGVALLLGLLLGWGIPGVALALLTNGTLRGSDLLGRALGLGVGYLFAASLICGLVIGHAPSRAVLLLLLALPNLVLLVRRRRDTAPIPFVPVCAALIVMVMLTAVLWQKVRHEHFSGDGTEIYEWSRSLSDHPLPFWDLEDDSRPGTFGVPGFASFAGAPLVHAQMTLIGRGEISARLPFVIALVILAALAMGIVSPRSRAGWLLAMAIAGLYVLWHAYFVGNEPPVTDLAESAGTDTLTMALWLAGTVELLRGSTRWGITFLALSSVTTMMGPPLMVLTLPLLWMASPVRAKAAWRCAALAGVMVVPVLIAALWLTGVGPDWWIGFDREFVYDLVTAEFRSPEWPLMGRLLISTAGLPLMAPFVWRRMSGTSRAFTLIGVGYLAIVLGGQQKTLHYLAPLPWICLVPALELATTRIHLTAVGLLATAFVFSWPSPRPVQRDAIMLGRESCIQGFDYQQASTGADVVYDAFDRPRHGERFSVGKHTFIRYAMDLGGRQCVIGMSPSTPEGAVTVGTNLQGALWTTNIDRFVWWRFHHVPVPASPLFRRPASPDLPTDASEWTGRINMDSAQGRAVLLEHHGSRARLLVPVVDPPDAAVAVGVTTTDPQLAVTINGAPTTAAQVRPVLDGTPVTGGWRRGWNIVELTGVAPFEVVWFTATGGRGGR
jgi:hypothetical protein